MLHLLEPGERVLAFEDIAVIYGWGVPQLPLGPPRSEEPQPWVYAVLTAPLAVAGWSPTMSILHGRTGYGHPSSLAAYFAAAARGVLSSRIVITDRRVLIIGDPRGMSFRVVFSMPDHWGLRFAAPRHVVAAASRRWYWLHWARLRLDFADGSWLKCVTSVGGGRRKVERVLAALRPEAVRSAGFPVPSPP